MKLKSTTWKGRNRTRLFELRDAALSLGFRHPTIADIGAGGITFFLSGLHPEGPKEEMVRSQKVQRFLIRFADDIIRKFGLYGSLTVHEIREIKEALACLSPSEIVVVDKDPRLLRAIRDVGITQRLRLDICVSRLPEPKDIVICYNVIQVTEDPNRALENLLDSVADGGLLSLETNGSSIEVSDRRYKRLRPCLYRKIS
ncbi:MAG: class I SAM-dependent methyltransferase [Candidatus Woesearchaeota archaeon]|nr:MAG: class I SAM-dependent methyltransferase [Candidatus Woesearchaeota archaeon]